MVLLFPILYLVSFYDRMGYEMLGYIMSEKSLILSNGVKIPSIGIGTCKAGKVKDIGVCNFKRRHIEQLIF